MSAANEPNTLAQAEITQAGLNFDQTISPLSREEFLSKFWRQSFVRVSGQHGRFAALLPWEELNRIIDRHHLKAPRLRLVRDGKPVDPSRYLALQKKINRLRPSSFVNFLSQGATLILDNVQDFAPAVWDLAWAFEDALHAGTTVNVYAGWRTQKGFDLHWDYQDTMILQVSGRKQWKVYRPTRLHPLQGEEVPKPTDAPVWEGILEDGDMLYMPRGWWHVAFPLDEPSLHLTMTIEHANGTDLLRWLLDGLVQNAEVRMTVPDPATAAEQKEYVSALRKLIQEQLSDDVLERFLAEWNSVPMRPQIQLPSSPSYCREPITMETRVRLASTGKLWFHEEPQSSVSFNTNGMRWESPAYLVPALKLLSSTAAHSIQELCAEVPNPSDSQRLIAFLTSMAMGGAIWIEPPRTPDKQS